jgi:short subunit dehydrogenase-like uncharacterized protein
MSKLMIYGANGYTGRLIAREAAKRNMQPMLAGRNREQVVALSQELNLPYRVFGLSDQAEIVRNLSGISVVLHCAGPFSQTSAPMLQACLAAKAHYLDITGEIDVFEACHRADPQAKHQGIVVLPGAGFDVVPTDCVSALLKRKMPNAQFLVIAFEAGGGPSPGTAKTSVEGLASGCRARVDGHLKRVPLGWKDRTFTRDGKQRTAMTIPWGDLYTAFVSTGIRNIETYMVVSPKTIANARRMRMFQPFLKMGVVQNYLKRKIERSNRGPSDERRRDNGCYVWGEVTDGSGNHAKLSIAGPNGYDLTVTASLGIAEHLLHPTAPISGGYFTPSQLMGAEYVLGLPGIRRVE